jgi:hypothetical protein
MTSCHNTEAITIDSMGEEYFGREPSFVFKNWFGTAQPMRQFEVKGYEESAMKFVGFVEGSDFGEGFIMIYKKMLAYFADSLLTGDHH